MAVVLEKENLTGIQKWLTEEFKTKQSGNKFEVSDVQGYIKTGNLPKYLGNYKIERVEEVESVKLYNVTKED